MSFVQCAKQTFYLCAIMVGQVKRYLVNGEVLFLGKVQPSDIVRVPG